MRSVDIVYELGILTILEQMRLCVGLVVKSRQLVQGNGYVVK
jgi:hypothetical protein